MSQQLTITIDGRDGEVLPDSVGVVLKALFAILKSMDERSWDVGTPRVKWRVSEARLVNPLTLTATGETRFAGRGSPDLAFDIIDRLQEIEKGYRPRGFTSDDLKHAKEIAKEVKHTRRLTIQGSMGGRERSFDLDKLFLKQINRIMKRPRKTASEYGSLDGTLIALVNDPLRPSGSAKLRDRIDGYEVLCQANAAKSAAMARYLNRSTRVILYGTITSEDGIPKRIEVEDFTTVPGDVDLPTLEDIHAMNLRPPEGFSVEDYLDDLRGDE